MTDDPLMTTAEVADELRIGRTAIYSLLRSGALPCINLGHKTKRVRRSDLDAYLAKCTGADNECN